jgi:hypothetical protein
MPHPNVFRFEEHPEARAFPHTTPESISAMSRRHGIRVLTDWAMFLLDHNGYDFNTVTAGKPMQAPFQYAETALYMFGVGTGFEFNDVDEVLKDEAVLEHPYRRLLTPVGMCAGGDLLAQITAGPRLGGVVRVDHNVHVGLGPRDFESRAQRSLSDSDPDTVIGLLMRYGLIIPLADTLQGFFERLIVETDDDGTVVNVQISA